MSHVHKKLWKAALAVSALATLPAYAANDAMIELLRVLKEKGTLDEASYEALVNAAKADDEHVKFATDEVKRMEKENAKIDTKGKLEITSGDKDFKFRIGGRVHADATFPDDDDGALRSTNFEDKYDLRRARLDATVTAYDTWQFKIQYDFADTGGSIQNGLRDAWIKYLIDGETIDGSITTGHFKEYIGLEELTSSNDISFVERSMMSGAFNANNGRRLGLGASLAFADMFTASVGGFGRAIGNAADDALKATGRLTFSPIHTKVRAVHLGAAGSWVSNFDNNTFAPNPRPEFDTGSGSRLFGNVGPGTTSPAFGIANADDAWRLGGEAAVAWGPWSLQGEYQRFELSRTGAAAEDLSFDGWYAFGSWVVTGESRLYEFQDGIFKNPKPSSPVGKGGIGAWEVLARYSTLDLLDEDFATCVLATPANNCGEQDNVTVGLNWYPTQNLKFMANYIHVLDFEGGRFDGAEPSAFALRAQAYF